MAEIQLKVDNLRKTFRPGLFEADVEVLKGLSLEVRQGEIFGFLGPNGAGKTTTIKAITEIIYPDSGSITVCGHEHTSPEAKKSLGFMAENPYVYRHLSGREYLRFCGELLQIQRTLIEQRITGVLTEVGMAHRADRPMGAYSKGMLQRIGLAQALLGEPELLVLDEPMSGLDPVGRRDVRDIILAQSQSGTTIFFSTHIIPDVEALCDRVAVIIDGAVRAVGSISDLVPHDTKSYDVIFSGMELDRISTPVIAHHVRSDATWVRVAVGDRDALIAELSRGGARLTNLNPVRANLEDLLMEHYTQGAS